MNKMLSHNLLRHTAMKLGASHRVKHILRSLHRLSSGGSLPSRGLKGALRFFRMPAHQVQLRLAHARSDCSQLAFPIFLKELRRCLAGRDSRIDFDEAFYLQANADVAAAVKGGTLHSGYVHYCLGGRTDQRRSSTGALTRKFGVAPHFPQDELTQPVNANPPAVYGPDLSRLPRMKSSLVIIVPYLRRDLFFAGYSAFFDEISTLFDSFQEITILVLMDGFDTSLVSKYSDRIRVLGHHNAGVIKHAPDLIFCFDYETFFMAKDIFNDLSRTVYYCQDFEPGFYPYGTKYIRALAAVALSKNLVVSTPLLRDFLQQRGLLSAANVFVTSPAIDTYPVAAKKTRKLFFYFRPEAFNSRNLPEFIMEAVQEFSRKHSGYELYLVGTVGTGYSVRVESNEVYVLSKLPKEAYRDLLTSCDVVISLIYSAHPGVVAFQAAASGIPTVTNTFENRDAAHLRKISANIVPYDPLRESLFLCIEEALLMDKGRPSFNLPLYAGEAAMSFPDFIQMTSHG